jgi:glycosyltransferase involved in cell wall biosynthesis
MISILLPFRNADTTVLGCLASIQQQSFRRFELLAIDDHCTDQTRDLISNWPDPRLRLLDNPGDGIVDALNFGIRQARYPLLARMDADDLMRSDRLETQFGLLRSRHDIDLVSSRVALFPKQQIATGYREYERWQNRLLSHEDIVAERFVESPLAHPSVMFRRGAIENLGGYRKGDFPEDYELWLRAIDCGLKTAKCDSVLIDWRESNGRLSRTHPAYRRQAFDRLRAKYLAHLPVLRRRPVAFWGAGRKTRLRARNLIDLGIQPLAWIDIDPKKIGNRIKGVPVHAPGFLRWSAHKTKPFVLVYVTNHGARELIQAQLDELGYQIAQDFLAVG